MKKIISILISIILILSISPTKLTNAETFENNISDKAEITNTIKGYLSYYLDLQKDLIISENEYILPNSKLFEFNELVSESIIKWYSSNDGQLDWYTLVININSIEEVNDTIKVNIDQVVNCQYIGADVTTSYSTNNVIYLKYDNNKLLVEKDIVVTNESKSKLTNNLSDEDYDEYINTKINIEKEKSKTMDSELKSIKEENSIKPKTVETKGKYNRNTASLWAIANVYSAEDYKDNDCSNFVSKALNAGGLPQDNNWKPGYYSWIRVINLRDYLVSSGRATQYGSIGYSELGDIIQFYNTDYNQWTHSVIVTNAIGSSNRLISAHSYPAKNVLFSSYFPGKPYYSNYRVLNITY